MKIHEKLKSPDRETSAKL